MILAPSSGAAGINPAKEESNCIPRSGAMAVGQVWQFDLARTSSYTTDNRLGSGPTSGFTNVVTPDSDGVTHLPIGISTLAANQHAFGRVALCGIVLAYVRRDSGNVTAGMPLYVKSGATYLTPDGSTGAMVRAKALDNVTTPTSPTLCRVLLSGLCGTGVKT